MPTRSGGPRRQKDRSSSRQVKRRLKIEHDRTLYEQRNRIERMFGRLKINRAIATRYDQLANCFLSMVHPATAR
jgi:transposase